MSAGPTTHCYLFELLLEEIPAWMVPARLEALRSGLERLAGELSDQSDPAAIRVGATSRRIWFTMTDLPDRQPDRNEEIKGPSARAAWDAAGAPTRALEGFLRKNEATLDQAERRDDYVWLKRTVPGKSAREILSAKIPSLILSLHWPKTMRWGAGTASYIRPIHSIVSILDGEPLPLEILGVTSGTATMGHRILSNRVLEIESANDYEAILEKANVIADPERRVESLRQRGIELAAEVGGLPADDPGIWEQWKFLTEAPGLVRAEFDRAFLSLPYEILVTVMRVHQKQLPVTSEGELTSSFLAVMDHTEDRDGNVASGNAFVTNARFADARFFHDTDRKRPLEERLPELGRLQFHEKLGDTLTRTERIRAMAEAIARELPDANGDAIREAARLAKADLVTEMVKEFPELQGQIGGIYAREEGQSEDVWMGIYDHYLPSSLEGEVPRTMTGAVVALADKLDTLTGFLRIGLKPTGSKDPFALRRAAQGIIQILLNDTPWRIGVPVSRLIAIALEAHGSDVVRSGDISADLHDFLGDRVRTLLEHPRYGGFAYDEIAAAMAAGWGQSLSDLEERLAALREARASEEFLSLLDSAKRIRNIVGETASGAVDAAALEHPTEKRLAQLADAVVDQIDELITQGRYRDALESFAAMAPELEQFFDDVLVMDDDETLRRNRIALLNRIGSAAMRIGDITKIVISRRDYNAG
ncbi:MAG TPA: glycine--tRNA ligase subunit beta [Thermoanaerobaculia bacterium]|nr:glycine--tRNA ligase subunit beta [Thermoanaerobaculia bacterium]